MTKIIKTIAERVTSLQKALAVIGMVAVVGVGIVVEDRFVADIRLHAPIYEDEVEVHSGKYTGYEYRQIREVIGLETSLLGDEDEYDIKKFLLYYVPILNIEAQKCGALYPVQSKADIRGMVKKFDTQGCPELPIKIR